MFKHAIFTILLFVTYWTFGQETKKDTCTKIIGKGEYRLADYSMLGWSKEMVDTLKPLVRQFEKCFCESKDKKFLRGLQRKEHTLITVEPKISNLKSCDGLYSYRTFPKKSPNPHFLQGIIHQVFLVCNSEVYFLNDLYRKDSLSVNKLVDQLTAELLKSYSEEDIDAIRYYGNRSVYWTENSIEVPLVLYSDKGVVYFDNRRKE